MTKQLALTQGMGTTVAGLVGGATELIFFNVGDSRVYREQNGYLRQLSIDDTSGPDGAGVGQTTGKRTSHVLMQALGGSLRPLQIGPHLRREILAPNSRYLICSDGLTDMVEQDTMEACLNDDDELTVMNLLERALASGGEDNISLLIVRILGFTAQVPSA
jgi:serine/threonine protein phosphatase PrpC